MIRNLAWNPFICFWLKTPIWVSCPLEWDNACLEIILFMDPACEEWVDHKAGIMDQTGSFCNVEIVLAIRFTLFTNQYKHSWWGKRKLSLSVETFKQFMNIRFCFSIYYFSNVHKIRFRKNFYKFRFNFFWP